MRATCPGLPGSSVETSELEHKDLFFRNSCTPTVENMNLQRRDYSGSSLINSYVYMLINLLILVHYEFSDPQRRD